MKYRWLLGGLLISPVLAADSAWAADQASDAIAPGDIVVTATRHAEALSKVAISATAFNGEALEKRGIKDISGIVRQVPGIQFDPNGFGNQTNIAIRGVSSNVGASTTGIYIDDTPIQSRQIGFTSTNAFPAIFDLDRVEVLRGPQGTLFGAGSEGGTVRFITPQPSLSGTKIYARAEGSATQGGAPSGEVGLGVNTPLVEGKLGLSLSAWIRRDGGFVDRKNGNPDLLNQPITRNVNSVVTKIARIALKWEAVDGLLITPSLLFQQRDQADSDNYWEAFSNPAKGAFVSGAPLASPDHDKFYLPALNIDYRVGGVQIISNTSYFARDQRSAIDYSTLWPSTFDLAPFVAGFPSYRAINNNLNTQRTFTQEVRVQSDGDGAFKWVVGAFYSRSVQTFSEQVRDPDFGALFGVPSDQLINVLGENLYAGQFSLFGYGRGVDDQLAGFGDVTYALTPALKLSAGLRVAQTKFTGSSLFDGPLTGAPQVQVASSTTEHPVTPRVAINWQANSGLMLYANAGKGYRIGGTNAPVPASVCGPSLAANGFTAVPGTYKSDSLWSYEAGAKGKTADGRLGLSGSVFHVDWSDIQQLVQLPSCGAQFVANLGRATSDGFDLQGSLKLTPEVVLDATLSYTTAQLRNTIPGAQGNIATRGDHLETHPWTLSIGASWDHRLDDAKSVYARADYQYKSRGRTTSITDSTTTAYDPTAYNTAPVNFASLRVGLHFDRSIDISAFVDNLTNAHPVLNRMQEVVGLPPYVGTNGTMDNFHHDITLRPRTFGVTVSFKQ